ncbi:MAG TPA: RagB/SusD family nutrient uptake outer membrane protein [Chitinophaga sp.]|uniref:RagB/SusD family nutrient uptake outer membrane protein n=1 Tax=Chitinophaga sp. TaxID=1869181 RepID=UPI002DB5A19B|nr:RagB/SusD family nutrient uptake outer membrane protein [Chitinophaga sp.]HEU4552821.1 RagB/SusD family nutrient uptake outer membrane protein [Chitinophaga sp.]
MKQPLITYIAQHKLRFLQYLLLAGFTAMLAACQKGEIPNLNTPQVDAITRNPTKEELNNLVTGAESGMRFTLNTYYDAVGIVGREIYRFAGSEPRFTSELLGGGSSTLDNNTFYITNPWAARYRVVRQCNILLQAAANSSFITDAQRKAYLGFAKTIMAYQLLLNLNMTDANGIRISVQDFEKPGPIVARNIALDSIAQMLEDGKADFTGSAVLFPLSSGFTGFNDAAGLLRFNRALAARVAVYRQQWAQALAALNESFFDLNGSLTTGVYHTFGTGSGDQLNPCFFAQNVTGEVRVAHPSYAADITPGDDRIQKATLRTAAASQNGLSSNRDVWIYTSNTAPIPIIRNEELILIYAEAKIQTNAFPDAVVALNRIRTAHNVAPYAGAVTQAALIDEMLRQRRYSLFYEGHRWIDLRRYNRLNTLPLDRPGDDVWQAFPIPQNENQ